MMMRLENSKELITFASKGKALEETSNYG